MEDMHPPSHLHQAWQVESGPIRLDKFLALQVEESRHFLGRQIEQGLIQVNQKTILKLGYQLRAGDEVTATWKPPTPLKAQATAGPLDILYEDADILCLNKPQGLVVHPGAGTTDPTLVERVLAYLGPSDFSSLDPLRPGVVHRLDKGTSGILVMAKHRKSLAHLVSQFSLRQVQKQYLCLSWGTPPLFKRIESMMARSPRDRKKMASSPVRGKLAITELHRLAQWGPLALLKINIMTGRTHQIRVHLSENGYPIVRDSTYGQKRPVMPSHVIPPALQHHFLQAPDFFLHASQLSFTHPTTHAPMSFEAPLNPSFQKALDLLGWDARIPNSQA